MTETNENKLPVWFWIVSVLALIWNFMGVGAFIMQLTMSDEARMKSPELERAMYAAIPTWYMIAFGIAVFAGFLGCVGLVLRKAWAVKLFILSFIAVLVQQLYMFGLTDIGKNMNSSQLYMTISIPIIALFLIWFSRSSAAKNWLN